MSAIQVIPYDDAWPKRFEEERERLVSLIGGLVAEVHHVGSTSIEGLSAKPKIDIEAVLCSNAVVAQAVERMKTVSESTFHGTPYNDGMWTFVSGHGSWGTRLYLCGPDNPTHLKRILFRDWLRSHPDDAAAYANLKHQLAAEACGDWKIYTGGKSDFVASIVNQALADKSNLASTSE